MVSSPGAVPATAIYFLYHLILEPLDGSGRTPGKRIDRAARAHARRPGADDRRAAHAQCVSHHRFHAVFYVVGLLFVIFGKRHLAPRRSGGRHRRSRWSARPFLEKLARHARCRQRRRQDGSAARDALEPADAAAT